ncbi:MAG: ornithine cyclodeaminase family protein [Syntrophobacteraceae bacterium]
MNSVEFLYLSQKDVLDLNLSIEALTDLVEEGLKEHGLQRVENPPKPGIHAMKDSFIHAMPSYLRGPHLGGIKWVSGYPSNREKDLPTIMGVLILNDMDTGAPVCMMDCGWITAVRTAAVSAITAKYCASSCTRTLGIIGAGVQGRHNLVALKKMIPGIEEAKVYDIVRPAAEKIKKDFEDELQVKITVCDDPEVAARDTQILLTATQKLPRPIVRKDWISKGCLCFGLENSRGWYGDAILAADKFITDDWEQTKSFQQVGAFPDGLPTLYAELGDIVCGRKPGRESDDEMIVAMSIGLALEDIMVGHKLYTMAKEKGIGQTLRLL